MGQLTPAQETLVDSYYNSFDFHRENRELQSRRFQEGLELGKRAKEIHITKTGNWIAHFPDGSTLCSPEQLGFTSGTARRLQGWLTIGVRIIDHRRELQWETCTCGCAFPRRMWDEHGGRCPSCQELPLPLIPDYTAGGSTQ